MKILVTGCEGQVGTELVERLEMSRHSLLTTNSQELDISDTSAVSEYFVRQQPDFVINAAAYTLVDKAEDEIDQAQQVNRVGPANLAACCDAIGAVLVHLSTDYVFDGNKSTAYSEMDEPNPQSVYGRTKLEGEMEVARKLKDHIILRVAWVFSKTGTNFVKTMLRLGTSTTRLSVVNDQFGAPTWAGDIAEAILLIVDRIESSGCEYRGTFHYVSEKSVSWASFAEVIFEKAERMRLIQVSPKIVPIPSSEYPTRASRPKNSVLDTSKVNRTFQIPMPDWEAALDTVLSELQSRNRSPNPQMENPKT